MRSVRLLLVGGVWVGCVWLCGAGPRLDAGPPGLQSWLETPQEWRRDTDGPVLSLGAAGAFDDTHLFAPTAARHGDGFRLWYCGSSGAVDGRLFRLGLAESRDGRTFQKSPRNPVFAFGDGERSVVTPTLLRGPDGAPLREGGRLRLWFSAARLEGGPGTYTIHQTTSADGVRWSAPSPAQLTDARAPAVIREADGYRMWFVDVSRTPWSVRHATSADGERWTTAAEPCLTVGQEWESDRLNYPTVLKADGLYFMWYGSRWTARERTTAIGFAVSEDGLNWRKHPRNPVLRPEPDRPWESHYVSCPTVLRLDDGSLRMWYASRKRPPFVNKYFAINTALWTPPPAPPVSPRRTDDEPPDAD